MGAPQNLNLTRQSYQVISDAFGRARAALLGAFGDTNKNPGALLNLEAVFCRLRQATMFHDDDGSSSLVQWGGTDPVGIGVLGGRLEGSTRTAPAFETLTSGTWYPRYYGVPSPEGWGVWGYNAWSSWDVPPQPGNTEPSYSTRLTKTRPVRWNGSAYVNVPYFRHGRWLSVLNQTGGTITSGSAPSIRFTLPRALFAGLMLLDAETDVPLDLRFYYYPTLVQTKSSGAWQAVALPSDGTLPTLLNHSVAASGDNYFVTVEVPSGLAAWPNGYYWHVIAYWGSHEDLSLSPVVSPPAPTHSGLAVRAWAKKNFFRNDLETDFGWSLDSIYGTDVYLKALNRTHFEFEDGGYSDPPVPRKYKLVDWPGAEPAGQDGSMTGYVRQMEPGNAVCVRLVARTQRSAYEDPDVDPVVLLGPKVTQEFWPVHWADSPYFPPEPDGYETLGRVVLVRPPDATYDIVDLRGPGFRAALVEHGDIDDADEDETPALNCRFSIAWMSQEVPSFALPPLEDADAVETMLYSLYLSMLELRLYAANTPIASAAFALMPRGTGLPASLVSGLSALQNPDNTPSVAFRGALKQPIDSDLEPESGYRAFEFDADTRRVVSDISGLPPSTVMARMDPDVVTVSGETLSSPNTFEIYMDPSDQCDAVSLETSGDRLQRDYTLRLKLLDGDENLFVKDWYVTASRYFLSDEEFNRRVDAGLSTTGYFKQSTLAYMDEFRLHGYAGVVPDLRMGDYQTLFTRVVSPDDETRVTEEQFRKNLENQGYSEEEIDEAVREFLDNGGEFLIIDLRQYDNRFSALKELGVCVSLLSFYDTPYWVNNINASFGFPGATSDVGGGEELETIRADSFTIAPSDIQIGWFEQYGDQALSPQDPSLDRTSNEGREKPFIDKYLAIKITTSVDSGVSGFGVRLRKSIFEGQSDLGNNPAVSLRANLHSSVDGLPSDILASGSSVLYDEVTEGDFVEYRFPLHANIAGNRTYWLVISKDQETTSGFFSFETKLEPATPVAWHYDNTRDPEDWIAMSGAPWVKAYMDDDQTVAPPFSLTSEDKFDDFLVYEKTASKMVVPSNTNRVSLGLSVLLQEGNPTSNLTNDAGKQLRVSIVSDASNFPDVNVVTSAGGVDLADLTTDYVEYSFELEEELTPGTYWVQVEFDEQPAGGWVRLARNGETSGYLLRGNDAGEWFDESSDVWLNFYRETYVPMGAFNRDTPNITEHLPPPNEQRRYTGVNTKSQTYKVETFWSWSSRRLPEPRELSIYPRAYYNPNTESWEYAPRSRDAYVKVKLWVNGEVVDKDIIKLDAAPGWRAKFWQKAVGQEKRLDADDEPTIDTIVNKLDYINYDGDDGDDGELGTSWNARFEGAFRPLYDGQLYTLVLEADTGARVFLNGSEEPIIDTWDSPVFSPVTYEIPTPLSQSETYTFVVEHYSAQSTQRLRLYWYPASNPIADFLGTDTALPLSPTEVSLGPELADGLAFLAVAKTREELETFTSGAPPGDHLVIRSS